MSYKKHKRAQFSSKFGVIAAAAGSAVGLGNIWKFPYITGQYGGGAFLVVYLIFILLIGMPVMLSEFIIGRRARKNPFGAFKKLAPKSNWRFVGLLGIIASMLTLSFYGVIAGWSIEYITKSALGVFHDKSPEQLQGVFTSFISSPIEPVIYQLIFMALTTLIIIFGIKNGIEKGSKIMMPLLAVIIIILDIRALTLPGASAGLDFLFKPDFSKLTADGVLAALGHAFFSLSLGFGTLITYGSYIDNTNSLGRVTAEVSIADTIVAILAGMAILPAVFAFGIEPTQGPGLVFITLPNVFEQITGGYFFSILFFVLLTLAALTSSISLLEVVVVYFSEELKIKRKTAAVLAAIIISLLGVICSLSMGPFSDFTIKGLNFFDALDWMASNTLLPLGGLFISLFIGWKLGPDIVGNELNKGGVFPNWLLKTFIFICRYVAPIAISVVFLNGVGILNF
ncbi:MAG: sodium-dependent transporter [Mangrovibacterium sp.]